MKILTVDDSMTARLIVKNTFQECGHIVFEAPDGAVALNVVASQPDDAPIDVIFLDWNMPVMTGIECLQELRKNRDYKNIKVVMCTTEAEKPSIMKAIQAGANGYVLKPVTPAALTQQLAKVTGAAA